MHIGRFADDFADLKLDQITLEAGDQKSAPEAELEDAFWSEDRARPSASEERR